MKRHLIVLLSVILVATLLIGCGNSMEIGLKSSTSGTSTPAENANESSIDLNEDALSLELKEKFLNSKEGHDFQVISWKFTKAFLSGDASAMKSYILDPDNKDHYYNTENLFEDIEFLILKLSPKDIKEDMVIAEYEFGLKGEDTLKYLYIEVKKVNNDWKVQHYGLEM